MPKILKVELTTRDDAGKEHKHSKTAPVGGWDGIIIGKDAIKQCPNHREGPEHEREHDRDGVGLEKTRAEPLACVLVGGVWTCTSLV